MNQTVVRTLSYSIPSALKTGIQWVHPTISFLVAKSVTGPPSFANKTSTATRVPPPAPATFQLHGIPAIPAKPATNALGVSGFQTDFANKRTFLEFYRPDVDPNTTFGFLSVDDGINNQLSAGAGTQTSNIVGMTTGLNVTFISTGTLPDHLLTEMLDQANYLLSLNHPPQTIFNTVTGLEIRFVMPTPNWPGEESLIVQTGTWGAGGIPFLPDCKPFDLPFPASCPFVTAVGATEFNDEPEETASKDSGGGFSNFFSRPAYQDSTVTAYLEAANNMRNTAFNVSGRAVSDISAVSLITSIQDHQTLDFLQTPEFSAAIFPSMVALLTWLGKPFAVRQPGAFNDMITGNNPGYMTDGFNSTAGLAIIGHWVRFTILPETAADLQQVVG
ncbi:Serine protease S53 [Mycena venus]|uniref:Serine protease S53 n=1 Tax=Mycena venus TaxID=2733690 RepID=A0A8H6X3G1_9AGAR|nr:Serine protease S53 [Mycena venus]